MFSAVSWLYVLPLIPIMHKLSLWTGEKIIQRLYNSPPEVILSQQDRNLIERQYKLLQLMEEDIQRLSTKINQIQGLTTNETPEGSEWVYSDFCIAEENHV